MYVYESIIGTFVFDASFKMVDQLKDKKSASEKYSGLTDVPESGLHHVLAQLKDRRYYKDFHQNNLRFTKRDIRASLKPDHLMIQAIRAIEESDRAISLLIKRVREWYELYNPEFSRSIHDHRGFVGLIIRKSKDELLAEVGIAEEESMGAALEKKDIDMILSHAKHIDALYKEKDNTVDYIDDIMKSSCPNILKIAGALIGSKLIEHAGSIKRLSEMPASTIQLLGAEKALFRHIKTGSRCPKYGLIINHPLVSAQKQKDKGKAARAVADKLSIAAKVDYFKGEYIADKLLEQLEKKISGKKR